MEDKNVIEFMKLRRKLMGMLIEHFENQKTFNDGCAEEMLNIINVLEDHEKDMLKIVDYIKLLEERISKLEGES